RQCRILAHAAARLAFITENERASFERHAGRAVSGRVIYNVAEPSDGVPPDPRLAADPRFRIASLSNYAWIRGTDRLVALAEALARRSRTDIVFVMAGDMRLPRGLPGRLGAIGRQDGTLADYAKERGVADFFLFLGHVAQPEAVLSASDALIKPTREANPWGRDILEAMAAAKPVISLGAYDRFVEDGVTGILKAEFDPAALATEIAALADDRARCATLGKAGRARAAALCNGPERAADLLALW